MHGLCFWGYSGQWPLFYDASVRLYHGQRLPFAMLAIGILLVFVVIPPVVLLLYPTTASRLCLERLYINMANVSAFLGVFQGHFKDGIAETWDWRWFSAAYLLFGLWLVIVSFNQPPAAQVY